MLPEHSGRASFRLLTDGKARALDGFLENCPERSGRHQRHKLSEWYVSAQITWDPEEQEAEEDGLGIGSVLERSISQLLKAARVLMVF